MSVELVNNILKASLIPSNKSEFKFLEYKIDIKKIYGLCELFNIDIKKFNDFLKYNNKITQQQLNEIFKNSCNNIFENIDSIITNQIEYDKELLKELFKIFDFSSSESINQQTNSIDFLKLFEEITHKTISKNLSLSDETISEEDETNSDNYQLSDQQEETNDQQNNGIKYLILLFREFGIISKDKRTNKINPEYKKYFKTTITSEATNKTIKPVLNEIQIDFDYFEPKKTNGRIIRPLKLLKIIKEKSPSNQNIDKKQLLEDLTTSEYIETSKQDRQTYYYIKKGVIDDFHKWLMKKYF